MPYPAGHRVAVRRRIVDSARRLFNRYAFDNVSIGQIMAGASLTHGGFYSYFKSKSDLYAEVLGCFFTDPNWKNCWDGVYVDHRSTDVGKQVIRAYLSREHFENVEDSCPMVALPSSRSRTSSVNSPTLASRVPARDAASSLCAVSVSMVFCNRVNSTSANKEHGSHAAPGR